MKKAGVKQAVILAGGLGTRLRPLTLTTPKPMIPIAGKPFLEHIITLLVKNGIEEIIILTGYKGERIEQYFQNGKKWNVRILYSNSGVDAGTGLRLKKSYPLLHERFLLLYGDNYWPLNLSRLYSFYQSSRGEALVTVYSNIDNYTKSNMYVHTDGLVKAYIKGGKTTWNYNGVDIGFFILNKKHVEYLPEEDSSFEEILLTQLINEKKLAGFHTHHRYYGLSNLERIGEIEKYFTPKKVVFLDRDGVINKKAPKAEYITRWENFTFLPDSVKALQLLSKRNYQIYIITNQAGIARGSMSGQQVDDIHRKMISLLKKKGVEIHGLYLCPHGWDEGCFCRKPKPGLFFRAASDHAINLFDSFCIGDDERDREAATLAGCSAYLVDSTHSFYDIVRNNLL